MAELEYLFEIQLGGVWTDVTEHWRHDPGCTITRGQSDQDSEWTPQTATFTLDNADQRYNPRYAPGPYYGLLVRNTPVRIQARAGGGVWRPRFYGEIAAWQPESNADGSDRRVPIQAAGILRRLAVTSPPARSSFRQWMNNHTGLPNVTNYWPLEDTPANGQFAPEIGDTPAILTTFRAVEKIIGKGEIAEWMPPVASLAPGDQIHMPVDMRGAYVSSWDVGFLCNFTDDETAVEVVVDCGVAIWRILIDPLPPVGESNGTVTVTRPDGEAFQFVYGGTSNRFTQTPLMVTLRSYQTGDAVSGGLKISWLNLNLANTAVLGYTGRNGAVRSITMRPVNGNQDVSIGGTWVGTAQHSTIDLGTGSAAASGYRYGLIDQAGNRWYRLSTEASVAVNNLSGSGPEMGTQHTRTYLENVNEIAATWGALLIEARDAAELRLHPISSQNYSVPTQVWSLNDILPVVEQVEDDRFTRNDVTVSTVDGQVYRAVKSTGDMSTAQIGVYDYEPPVDANPWSLRSTASDLAAFLLAQGTWAGPRIPSIGRTLHTMANIDASNLMHQISDPGSTLQLTDLELLGIHDPIDLRVIGYVEFFNPVYHRMDWNCIPADVFRQAPTLADMRIDSSNSVLTAGATSTATALTVATTQAVWSTTAAPFDITVAGERMTVTAVAGASSPQTFTVTRSVNGVVKDQTADTPVRLYRPYYLRPKIGT